MEQRTRQIRGCSGCLYVSAIARTGGCYIAWGCSSLLPVGTNPGFQLFLLCHNSLRKVSLYFRMFYRWSAVDLLIFSRIVLMALQNLVNQKCKSLTYTKKANKTSRISVVPIIQCTANVP